MSKTIYITEEQKKKIKKAMFEPPKSNEVDAGVMAQVAYGGGMMEGAEPESNEYGIGFENDSNLEYAHVNENESDESVTVQAEDDEIQRILDYGINVNIDEKDWFDLIFNGEKTIATCGQSYYKGWLKHVNQMIGLVKTTRHPSKDNPSGVLVGYARLAGVVKYSDFTFQNDYQFHKVTPDLEDAKDRCGLKLIDVHQLTYPIKLSKEKKQIRPLWREGDPNRPSDDFQLNEGTNMQTLYHFTSPSNLSDILSSNSLECSDEDLASPDENGWSERLGRKYYISLTRHRSSAEGFPCGANFDEEDYSIRIELDATKLNSIHGAKIEPYEYYSPKRRNDGSDKSAKSFHIDRKMKDYTSVPFGAKYDSPESFYGNGAEYLNQAEEKMEFNSPDGKISPLLSYTNRIDIYISDSDDDLVYNKHGYGIRMYIIAILSRLFYKKFENWKDKIFFYADKNEYDMQTNKCYSIEDALNIKTRSIKIPLKYKIGIRSFIPAKYNLGSPFDFKENFSSANINESVDANINILPCLDYYGDKNAQKVSHGIKDGNLDDIKTAAMEMSKYVKPENILVPVPSRNGMATTTKQLAEEIAKIVGCKIKDIIHGNIRKSLYQLKYDEPNFDPDKDFFGFSCDENENLDNCILIDNVLDTGNTARAAALATGIKNVLVYARHNSDMKKNINESIDAKHFDYEKSMKSIMDFMKHEGLNVYPYPHIKLKWDDQDGLFIRTGYYEPSSKTVVVFCKDRHPKDILRSFSHEMIHHMQNLDGQDLDFNTTNVKDDDRLEKIESEAYVKGNIYFRKWTEHKNSHEMLNENTENELQAWHGATADFDAFDESFMGSGEGAQAYGWGTYITSCEGTGRIYAYVAVNRNMKRYFKQFPIFFNPWCMLQDGIPVYENDDASFTRYVKELVDCFTKMSGLIQNIANDSSINSSSFTRMYKQNGQLKFKTDKGVSSTENGKNNTIYNFYLNNPDLIEDAVKEINNFVSKVSSITSVQEAKDAIYAMYQPRLYEVEIPDDDGDNYVAWDKPLTEKQKPIFINLINKYLSQAPSQNKGRKRGECETIAMNGNVVGGTAYKELRDAIAISKGIKVKGEENVGLKKIASKELYSFGIVGVKVPTGFKSRNHGDGHGTNYVLFNDKDVKIINKSQISENISDLSELKNGININIDNKDWLELIFSGKKTVETRDGKSYSQWKKHEGETVGLVMTTKRPTKKKPTGMLVGSAKIAEVISYTQEDFATDDRHKCSPDMFGKRGRCGLLLTNVEKFETPVKLVGKGQQIVRPIEIADILEETTASDIDLSSFNIKKNLNPKFWKDEKLDSRVRIKLLDIADDFIEFIGVDWVKPEDIIITGSLANFNWNQKYSDIDLHVVLDYSKVDKRKDFVSNYFYSQKKLWNDEHKGLKIFGFPIEVYVQDKNEKHTSSGVYSLEKNEWIEEPERKKLSTAKVNKQYIKNKVAEYADKIDNLKDIYKKAGNDEYKIRKASESADKLFDEIKSLRKKDLEGTGNEISNGNIIFKCLRRLNYIEKLVQIKSKSYDKLNSLS